MAHIIFFSVDSYDLKSESFKFGNNIFITFEMPRVAYIMSVGKINISLLFCPSVIRGPCLAKPSPKIIYPCHLQLLVDFPEFGLKL